MKKDIESIYKWCSIVIDFFLEKDPSFLFMEDLRLTLAMLESKRNMKGLMAFKKEMEKEFISELSEVDSAELNALLKNEPFLIGFDTSKEVKSVIDRGHIISDDEYRLLTNYINEDTENIEVINRMLVDFSDQLEARPR